MDIKKDRNLLFDNIKVLLIFLVVFGHIIELFLEEHGYGTVYNLIYSFHMPAFVFIAGYFSKNITKQREEAINNFLIPFIIFNGLYQIIGQKIILVNIFTPSYVYWFLLSMFIWKIMITNIISIRYCIIFAVLLSLYSGIFNEVSRFLSLSRTLVFLPYFIMGYYTSEKTIKNIRKIPKSISIIAGVIIFIILVFLLKYNILPSGIFKGADSYQILGIANLDGMLSRFFLIIIAILIIGVIINIIPNKKYFFTYLGSRTITIYLLHPYFIILIRELKNYIKLKFYIGILLYIVISVIIVFILGTTFIQKIYTCIFDYLNKKLIINFKEKDKSLYSK